MKAIVISRPGGPEVLRLEQRPKPLIAPNEVLVKVAAAGVNRPDVYQRKGNYPPPKDASADIPGLEIAGTIVQTGERVRRWKVGDKVCALVSGGGYAQYCNAAEEQCLPVPGKLTFVEAASLPETFFTVWSNVFDRGKLRQGESLLVHGGTSGIGVTAIQMAVALGSKVYVTAGSDEKCKYCQTLGAVRSINYKRENFPSVISQCTGGKGVEVILDMIGGDYTPGNLASLAEEGRLVLINAIRGKQVVIDLAEVMQKRLIITGSMLRARDTGFKSHIARNLEQHIWPLIESGKIKPVIHAVFAANQAPKAHELMESSEHVGKIVLKF